MRRTAGFGYSGCDVVSLPVPEIVENIESRIRVHRRRRALEQCEDPLLGKANQELAHPDGVESFREGLRIVEEIDTAGVDPILQAALGDVFDGQRHDPG